MGSGGGKCLPKKAEELLCVRGVLVSLGCCKFQWAKFRGCGAGGGPLAGWVRWGPAGLKAQKPPFDSGSPFPGRPERDSAR